MGLYTIDSLSSKGVLSINWEWVFKMTKDASSGKSVKLTPYEHATLYDNGLIKVFKEDSVIDDLYHIIGSNIR